MIRRRVTRPPPMYMRRLLPCSGSDATAGPSRRSASTPDGCRARRGSEEEDEEDDDDNGGRARDAEVDASIAHRSSVEPTVTLHPGETAIHDVTTHSVCHAGSAKPTGGVQFWSTTRTGADSCWRRSSGHLGSAADSDGKPGGSRFVVGAGCARRL